MDAMMLYKISNWLYRKKLGWLAKRVQKINNSQHNSYIPCTAQLGKDTVFAYGGIGMVIHSNAIVGKKCMIGQGITIGGRTGHGGAPVIGNNVYIAAGSRVLGGITIGNNVVIGVNAVVIKDVPDNCIVAGVPAKIISRNISKFTENGVI